MRVIDQFWAWWLVGAIALSVLIFTCHKLFVLLSTRFTGILRVVDAAPTGLERTIALPALLYLIVLRVFPAICMDPAFTRIRRWLVISATVFVLWLGYSAYAGYPARLYSAGCGS